MNKATRALLAVVSLVFTFSAGAEMPTIDWELDDAVRQIDRQADDFNSAMARVSFVMTDLDGNRVRSHSGNGFINEKGDIRYSQDGGNRVLLLQRSTVQDYDKSTSTVDQYSLSKHKDRIEPYYRLGFSIAGRDMQDRYLTTIIGEQQIGDARTLVLELTPKKDAERAIVGKITLWIDQASWMPRRQEIASTHNGMTTTLDFTNMARNLQLNPDLFDDDWPRGTKRNRH